MAGRPQVGMTTEMRGELFVVFTIFPFLSLMINDIDNVPTDTSELAAAALNKRIAMCGPTLAANSITMPMDEISDIFLSDLPASERLYCQVGSPFSVQIIRNH